MNNEEQQIKFLRIIENTINLVASIVTIIMFISAHLTAKYLYYFLCFLFLILLIVIYYYKNKISKYILTYLMSLTCPDKNYKLTEKEIFYEFSSRTEMTHTKKFKVKVLHDGFNGVTDRYKWTGDHPLIQKPISPNQSIEFIHNKFGMVHYKIKFNNGKTYNKKDDIKEEIGMIIENIQDSKKTSSLHLSSGVYELTDLLILHVIFDKSLQPKNIRKLEFIHYSDDEHFSSENTTYSYNNKTDKKEVVWSIKKPIYGGKYMIEWEFDEPN